MKKEVPRSVAKALDVPVVMEQRGSTGLNSGNKSPLKFEGSARGLAFLVQEAELGRLMQGR